MQDTVLIPAYASKDAVAAAYGVSISTVNRLLTAGQVRAVKAGTKVLIDLASVTDHFASLPPAQYRQQRAA